MCLAQGHNAVHSVRLKPLTHLSEVQHSTIEPLPYREAFSLESLIELRKTKKINSIFTTNGKILLVDCTLPGLYV